jgi:hypothetical protein
MIEVHFQNLESKKKPKVWKDTKQNEQMLLTYLQFL